MPLLQVNAGRDGPEPGANHAPLNPDLVRALDTDSSGPIIVMVHGFKFCPGSAATCPHRHILSLSPRAGCWKALSWPCGLGFGAGAPDEGLGIAFGWPARGSIWRAYDRAEQAGEALARVIAAIRRIAPGRPIHALAHSLGARVVLTALRRLNAGDVDRVILLAGAEYGATASDALSCGAGRTADVINITSRENDLFDFMMERLIAAPEPGDRMMSHTLPRRPNTLTVQMDHHGTLEALDRAGYVIAPPSARICHWSSYLRPGVFDFYRALLRQSRQMPLARLRAVLPERPDPRWSRILPAPTLPRNLPLGRNAAS